MITLAEHECPTPNYADTESIAFTFALGRDKQGLFTKCLGCGEKFRELPK